MLAKPRLVCVQLRLLREHALVVLGFQLLSTDVIPSVLVDGAHAAVKAMILVGAALAAAALLSAIATAILDHGQWWSRAEH